MSGAGRRPVPPHARVARPDELPAALRTLGVGPGRPVLVLVGGAAGIAPGDLAVAARLLDRLVPKLDRWGAAVVDGGTDAGVMRAAGAARTGAGARFPLVGVAAAGTVSLPGAAPEPDAAEPEPRHTQLILVPGDDWGDESPWLSEVASAIADGESSLTLVVNGGEIAYADIANSLRAGRPVIIAAGSGRTADDIAAAARGEGGESGAGGDPRAARVAADPGVRIVQLADPQEILGEIAAILAPPDRPGRC